MTVTRSVLRGALEVREKSVREDGGTDVEIGGYGLRFDTPARIWSDWYESFAPGSFPEEARPDVRLLRGHTGEPLARTTSGTMDVFEDDEGLGFTARLDTGDPEAQSVLRKIARGDLDGVSIGFLRAGQESQYREDEDGTVHETITRVGKLLELSLVSFPAHESSEVDLRDAPSALRDKFEAQRPADAGRTSKMTTRMRAAQCRLDIQAQRASAPHMEVL